MVWAAALILAAGTANLDLDCAGGTVTSAATQTTSGTVVGTYGSASGSIVTSEPTYVPFSVRIRITGIDGSVQFEDGSQSKLRKLVITDDEIRAKVSIGLLMSSSVYIDRRKGSISTSQGFRGTCKPHVETTERAF